MAKKPESLNGHRVVLLRYFLLHNLGLYNFNVLRFALPKPANLIIENRNNALWIILPEAVTWENNPKLQSRIESKILYNPPRVVIDLSQTKTIYSLTLGLILYIRRCVLLYNGFICVTNINKKHYNQLHQVKLQRVVPLFAKEKDIDYNQKTP